MQGREFYKTKSWQQARGRVIRYWKENGLRCGYCGQPIVWGTDKVVVDHIINRRARPDLALDLGNLQCVHGSCNTSKYYRSELRADTGTVGDDGFIEGSEWS